MDDTWDEDVIDVSFTDSPNDSNDTSLTDYSFSSATSTEEPDGLELPDINNGSLSTRNLTAREYEKLLISKYDEVALNPRRSFWYLIDVTWLEKWGRYVGGRKVSCCQYC